MNAVIAHRKIPAQPNICNMQKLSFLGHIKHGQTLSVIAIDLLLRA